MEINQVQHNKIYCELLSFSLVAGNAKKCWLCRDMCSASSGNDCTCMLYSTVYNKPSSVQHPSCSVCQNDKCCVEISTPCPTPKSCYYSREKLTSLTSTYNNKTRGMASRIPYNFNTTTYTALTESPTSAITIIVTESIIDNAGNNIFKTNTILVTVVLLSIVIILIIIFFVSTSVIIIVRRRQQFKPSRYIYTSCFYQPL